MEGGAFRRAWARSKQHLNRFLAGVVLVGIASTILSNLLVAPQSATGPERVAYGLASFVAAIAIVVAGAFGWALLRDPYDQRDALRLALSAAEDRMAAQAEEIARLQAPAPGPTLALADQLETDIAANCFRLRVWNTSRTAVRPCVELTQLTEHDFTPLVDESQLPLELAWTHHETGRPSLSSQDALGRTVAVLCLDQRANAAEAQMYVYGRGHKPRIGRVNEHLKGKTIYATVAARSPEHPATEPVERVYVLRFDPSAPLRFIP
jgi:hypothetical protein